VARTEWAAVRALRELRAEWSGGERLPDSAQAVYRDLLAAPVVQRQELARTGDAEVWSRPAPEGGQVAGGRYAMPYQTHGSIGPSCAVAEYRAARVTVWSAT
jgi:nicotinate dehydrogenase subunit B